MVRRLNKMETWMSRRYRAGEQRRAWRARLHDGVLIGICIGLVGGLVIAGMVGGCAEAGVDPDLLTRVAGGTDGCPMLPY